MWLDKRTGLLAIGLLMWLAALEILGELLIGWSPLEFATYFGADTGQRLATTRFYGYALESDVSETYLSREYLRLGGALPAEKHWVYLGGSGRGLLVNITCILGHGRYLYDAWTGAERLLPVLPEQQRFAFISGLLREARRANNERGLDKFIFDTTMSLPDDCPLFARTP